MERQPRRQDRADHHSGQPDGDQAGDIGSVGRRAGPHLVRPDLHARFYEGGLSDRLTGTLGADPNQAKVAKAFQDLASYEGKLYGTGFTPDVSVLLWNKDLFEAAGLDPEKPPTTLAELQDYATKIHETNPEVAGYYFSGSCGGCNIFTQAPMMWGSGATLLPTGPDAPVMEGPGVAEVLTMLKEMWEAGVIPESAEGDTGANFMATFETGT
ncbi:MAG: extracellular solute-binding protein, partial [Verrucomicrobiaceae bacterium]